jgi:hypothetical protein
LELKQIFAADIFSAMKQNASQPGSMVHTPLDRTSRLKQSKVIGSLSQEKTLQDSLIKKTSQSHSYFSPKLPQVSNFVAKPTYILPTTEISPHACLE